MTIRLTALLVAVVFVVGTMLVPAELYAAESETGEVQAAAVEETATEPAGAAAEETEPVLTEESEAEAVDAAEQEATEVVAEESEEAEETEETVQNDLSEALTVDLDRIDEDAYDGFIYKLKDDATKTEIKEMESAIEELDNCQEVSEVIEKEIYTADSLETIGEIVDSEMIDYIEPDYILHACMTPNDPDYKGYSWQMEYTNIPYIWDRGISGSGAVVAALDSGVNMNHEDLAGVKFQNPYNMIDDNTNVSDGYGHGTSVVGIIAATRNNGIGFAGAMSGTAIMPVKVLRNDGSGPVSKTVKGINYAVTKDADVINLSLGATATDLGNYSKTLEDACNKAVDSGCIVVASSGNEATASDPGPVMYPAGYERVASVGSVNKNKQRSYFSTYNDQLTVVAPGEGVRLLDKDGYRTYSGTSFAGPQVSAMAAMVKSINPEINQSQFIEILKSTSTDLGDSGRDDYYGYGLIDYGKTFEYLMAQVNTYKLTLSSTVYDYSGTVKTPSTMLSYGSIKLIKDEDYMVKYALGRTAVGTYKITFTGINGYSGTKSISFQIRPPLVKSIKTPKRGKKKLTVRWKAMSSSQKSKYKNAITGYQVRVARKANFSNAKYKKVKGISKTSVTVKGLKKKKTYYVQYRAYNVVGSTTYYSKWSSKKKAKTK